MRTIFFIFAQNTGQMINEKKFADTYVHFDKETVVEIIDIFIEEYEERIGKISQQIENRDFENLQKSAHAFKGVIANFEMECMAYEEITMIEEKSRIFLDSEWNKPEAKDRTEEILQQEFAALFVSFKKHSRQILNQLKSIRHNYLD
jgi:HPt (histidine-containing phosphotransfer) domain-containing protein